MKLIKYSIFTVLAAVALSVIGCEEHKDRFMFTDGMAYVAWGSNAVSIQENGGEQSISIHLASASGLSANVSIEVVAEKTTAVEGVHYTLESNSVSFTRDAPIQQFKINVIDNDIYEGNKRLTLKIGDISNPNVGTLTDAELLCTITIIDDEHPWKAIIGSYIMNATSFYDGPIEETLNIIASEDDPNILLLDFGFGETAEMAVKQVDDDADITISIQNGQSIGTSGSYGIILQTCELNEDHTDIIATNDSYITGIFLNNVITIDQGFGFGAMSGKTLAGWFDAFEAGTITFTKQ